jgi:nucleoside-diphosphate-sugar epimerase
VRVLLTGSAGFLGRHLLRALTARGDVVAEADLTLGVDCLDLFRVSHARYDLAIHAAAVVGGRATIDGSPLAVATNLALDAWFFRWLELSRTPRAVYLSSSAVYPTGYQVGPSRVTLRERMLSPELTSVTGTNGPDGTYGLVKLVGERLATESDAVVHVVRPFSGYGTDQATDYPFGAFVARARRRDDPFEVWGDGEQVRDWIHVEDIVNGILAVVDHDVREPVNLCTGRGTSFNELATRVTDAVGYHPTLAHRVEAPTGVTYRVGDPALFKTFHRPQVSLEAGIQRALGSR